MNLFITLDVIANGKLGPVFEIDTTFRIFSHFGHVFLDVLQRGDRA